MVDGEFSAASHCPYQLEKRKVKNMQQLIEWQPQRRRFFWKRKVKKSTIYRVATAEERIFFSNNS